MIYNFLGNDNFVAIRYKHMKSKLAKVVVAVLVFVVTGVSLHSQEGLRHSQAGREYAEARLVIPKSRYNIKLGEFYANLQSRLRLEYDSNIYLREINVIDDFIVQPEIKLMTYYPLSRLNALRLDITAGYRKYIENGEADSNFVSILPSSALNFDVFIGDLRLNIHDFFGFGSVPVSAVNRDLEGYAKATFGRFTNRLGLFGIWDLNDMWFAFGGDWIMNRALFDGSDLFDYTDNDLYTAFARLGFVITPTFNAGIEATATWIENKGNFNNDGMNYSIGPFFDLRLSDYFGIRGEAGITGSEFKTGGANLDYDDSVMDWYLKLIFEHEVNQFLSHTLQLGREVSIGYDTNYYKQYFARAEQTWKLIKDLNIGTNQFIEWTDPSAGPYGEEALRWGAGIHFGYQLTKQDNLKWGYEYLEKDSKLFLRDYVRHLVFIEWLHRF